MSWRHGIVCCISICNFCIKLNIRERCAGLLFQLNTQVYMSQVSPSNVVSWYLQTRIWFVFIVKTRISSNTLLWPTSMSLIRLQSIIRFHLTFMWTFRLSINFISCQWPTDHVLFTVHVFSHRVHSTYVIGLSGRFLCLSPDAAISLLCAGAFCANRFHNAASQIRIWLHLCILWAQNSISNCHDCREGIYLL